MYHPIDLLFFPISPISLLACGRILPADVILFSTCLNACSNAQQWEHAVAVFQQLQDLFREFVQNIHDSPGILI